MVQLFPIRSEDSLAKNKQEIDLDVHFSLDLKYLALYTAKAICLKIHFGYLLRWLMQIIVVF